METVFAMEASGLSAACQRTSTITSTSPKARPRSTPSMTTRSLNTPKMPSMSLVNFGIIFFNLTRWGYKLCLRFCPRGEVWLLHADCWCHDLWRSWVQDKGPRRSGRMWGHFRVFLPRFELLGSCKQISGWDDQSCHQCLHSIDICTYNAGKTAGAFQIPAAAMIKAFCKPRIKVGTEWVTKGEAQGFAKLYISRTQVRLASRLQEVFIASFHSSVTVMVTVMKIVWWFKIIIKHALKPLAVSPVPSSTESSNGWSSNVTTRLSMPRKWISYWN